MSFIRSNGVLWETSSKLQGLEMISAAFGGRTAASIAITVVMWISVKNFRRGSACNIRRPALAISSATLAMSTSHPPSLLSLKVAMEVAVGRPSSLLSSSELSTRSFVLLVSKSTPLVVVSYE